MRVVVGGNHGGSSKLGIVGDKPSHSLFRRFLIFKFQIDCLFDIVNKLQQKVLELLPVQAQVQSLKVILQP